MSSRTHGVLRQQGTTPDVTLPSLCPLHDNWRSMAFCWVELLTGTPLHSAVPEGGHAWTIQVVAVQKYRELH